MTNRLFIAAWSAIALTGCVSFSNVKPGDAFQLGPDEGLVVIGVPSKGELVFHSGDAKDGKFAADMWVLPHGIAGAAEEGFLIRKLKATPDGRRYGMVMVNMGGWYSGRYSPRCNDKMPTLSVEAGKIQYFGDILLEQRNGQVGFITRRDTAAAKARLAKLFNIDADAVQDREMEQLQQGRCSAQGGVTYIPVYIPSGR